MTLILDLAAFLGCAAVGGHVFRRPITDTIPVVFSLLMILLSQLAILGRLSLIDPISLILCLLCLLYFFTEGRAGKLRGSSLFPAPLSLLLLALTLSVLFLGWNMAVTYYDDFSFWATSVKSLYLRDGIAAANRNQSFIFGDYPLGSSLIQWWFMHLAGQWQERWLFIGYSLFLYSFLIPLFPAKGCSFPKWLLFFALALVLPYCGYSFSTQLPPEAAMAAVYGCAILFTIRCAREPEQRGFCSLAMAGFLGVLVQLKSIGLLWSVLAWGLWVLLPLVGDRKLSSLLCRCLVILPALLLWKQWDMVCAAREMTTDLTFSLSDPAVLLNREHLERAGVFLRSVFLEGHHRVPVLGWKVTIGVFFIVLGLCFGLLVRRNLTGEEKRLWSVLGLFLLVTTVLYEASLLFSVLTMFFEEEQYRDSSIMVLLLSRYSCVPMYTLLLLVADRLIQAEGKALLLPCAVCVLLLGLDPQPLLTQVSQRLSGEIPQNPAIVQAKETLSPFYASLSGLPDPLNSRVLYCDNVNNDGYVQVALEYYSGGTSVVCTPLHQPEELWIPVNNFAITHVYIASDPQGADPAYSSLTGGEGFSYDRLYEVAELAPRHLLLK